jgi:hypothetical protein
LLDPTGKDTNHYTTDPTGKDTNHYTTDPTGKDTNHYTTDAVKFKFRPIVYIKVK